MQSNPLTTVLLPLALAIVMLGMGLGLTLADFRPVVVYPKAVAAGLGGQLVLLPVCSGGASSNLITYLAKGDVALSVTLTALSSLVTVFTIPLWIQWAGQRFWADGMAIDLPLGSTLLQLAAIVVLPTGLGMLGRALAPAAAQRLEKQVSWWAAGLLALIIGLLLLREGSQLPLFLQQAGIATVLLNGLAMGGGCPSPNKFAWRWRWAFKTVPWRSP